jgi:hypothetical protein
MGSKFAVRLPTFDDMIQYYGPYLGLVLSLIVLILILQFIWFRRVLNAKNEEIKRLAGNQEKLNDRILHMIDAEIGFGEKIK